VNKTKQELLDIIQKLTQELIDAKDEVEALWFMLDELKASDEALKKNMDDYENELMLDLLSKRKPVGDA